MNHSLAVETACLFLFIGMSVVSFIFHRIALRLEKKEGAREVSGAVIGAVFALLGLFLAFTYSDVHARFDERRHLIVREANAIGSAYLQLDLLAPAAQVPLREEFRQYVVSRIALYERLRGAEAVKSELAKTTKIEAAIWSRAVAATFGMENEAARLLLLPTLTEMFDLVTTRSAAIRFHPPLLVFVTLFAIAIVCTGLTGYRAGISNQPGLAYSFLMAAITSGVVYLILDIEYPRYGLVRLDTVNQVLVELLKQMQ